MITKEIYLAGGCYWGTEHFFKQIADVLTPDLHFDYIAAESHDLAAFLCFTLQNP